MKELVRILLKLKGQKLCQIKDKYMEMIIQSVYLMHPLVQVKSFMTFFRMINKLLLKILLFGSTLIEKFGKAGSLKYL